MFITKFFGKDRQVPNNPAVALDLPEDQRVRGKTAHFNLVHILDTGAMHGLQGYRELIETLGWGLEQLGMKVSMTENQLLTGCVNIVFGAQVLPVEAIRKLPAETIIYNLEQMGGLDLTRNPVAVALAERLHIWDYSESNLASWQKLHPIFPVQHVPVGWAPILARIPKPDLQDIDVLIYGKPGPLRLEIFDRLCQRGLKCLFVCGLYGQARDELIARAKLVLNINLYAHSRIFEIVRVSYLLANAKAVVADMEEDTYMEPDLRQAVALGPADKIVDACVELIGDNARREELERCGRNIMERRHIVPVLESVLGHNQ